MAVSTDWRSAAIAPADFAMLEFGERLTLTPAAMTHEDVNGLRRHGFDDGAIVAVTLAAAYRNYIIRVADALGVELRRNGGYAPEILHAFGVSADGLRTTIYADRLGESGEATAPAPPRSGSGRLPSRAEAGRCWVDTTPADRELFAHAHDVLRRLTAPYPLVNLGRAFARRPQALASTVEFARLLGMGGSGLGRRTEAIMGLVVAGVLRVPYLGVHHAQVLLDHGGSADQVAALVSGQAGEPFSDRERAIIRFCARAVRAPSTMRRGDVESLRAVGLDDRAILTVAAGAAFETFLGGVAAGLGVPLEDDAFTPEARAAFAELGTAA